MPWISCFVPCGPIGNKAYRGAFLSSQALTVLALTESTNALQILSTILHEHQLRITGVEFVDVPARTISHPGEQSLHPVVRLVGCYIELRRIAEPLKLIEDMLAEPLTPIVFVDHQHGNVALPKEPMVKHAVAYDATLDFSHENEIVAQPMVDAYGSCRINWHDRIQIFHGRSISFSAPPDQWFQRFFLCHNARVQRRLRYLVLVQ